MTGFLEGATALAAFAVAVFFLRYWRDTRDRLFGVFALAFALFGVSRTVLYVVAPDSDARTAVYLLRAATFIALIVAIVDKNLSSRTGDGGETADAAVPGTTARAETATGVSDGT